MSGILKRFWKDQSGAYAIMMGIATIPLLLGVGTAVDYGRLVRARSHIQQLADGTALALAASRETKKSELDKLADNYVKSNTEKDILDKITGITVDPSDEEIKITLDSTVSTYFMSLANIRTMNVTAGAVADRALLGKLEVSLVLDNTDSMTVDNKIGTLKKAATNLVTALFKENDSGDGKVRVSLVPYAEQINIGLKNRKAPYLSVPDDYYATSSKTTTTTTPGYWKQDTKKTNECLAWNEAKTTTTTTERDGVMYTTTTTTPRSCKEYRYENVGQPYWVEEKTETKTTTTTTQYSWYGCIGARVDSSAKQILNDQKPSFKYPGYLTTPSVKQRCLTEVLPLNASQSTIKAAISGMITSRSGYTPNTFIPGGMMWGINTLSPEGPFGTGSDAPGAYDPKNQEPRKAIVLMTDGLNTQRVLTTGIQNTEYLKGTNFIGSPTAATAGAQRAAVNADSITLCDYAKSKGIEVFTVAFAVPEGDPKSMLKKCATDESHYYDATDADKLLEAFEGIARSLRVVRLVK
ncbi:pilus assembly protein [Mesorhizobium sp. RP14(2022)]|uniref:Pilus assembly protein n=1 Tax=Mesorhizobium liriopis TaxID=2953882 RepID=A0ABT1C4T1_9HYPH|nr:TadE/TadG family type IV pilus assembly protein [Mesorhizobium liriopis]MCO6049842.1 pilus assembly protein [Mesorhizobium liriopis]